MFIAFNSSNYPTGIESHLFHGKSKPVYCPAQALDRKSSIGSISISYAISFRCIVGCRNNISQITSSRTAWSYSVVVPFGRPNTFVEVTLPVFTNNL